MHQAGCSRANTHAKHMAHAWLLVAVTIPWRPAAHRNVQRHNMQLTGCAPCESGQHADEPQYEPHSAAPAQPQEIGAAGQKQHCSQAVQKGQVCMHCIAHLIMHVVLHTQLTTVNGNMPKAGNVSPLAQHSCRCSPGYTAINVACQSRLSAKGTAFWDGVTAAEPAKDAASLQPQHDTTTAAYGVLSRLQMSRTNIPAASPSPNQPTCRCCAHISAA